MSGAEKLHQGSWSQSLQLCSGGSKGRDLVHQPLAPTPDLLSGQTGGIEGTGDFNMLPMGGGEGDLGPMFM